MRKNSLVKGRHPSLSSGTAAVVICRNQGKYLQACLDSLLSQTLPFDEIVLIDDDSSDETRAIWKQFYQDKVVYERGCFGSVSLARDAGIRRVKAGLVTCVDADDWVDAAYHEKLSKPFAEDPLTGIVYCGQRLERDPGSEWFPGNEIRMAPFNLYRLWKNNLMPSAALFRRSLWTESVMPTAGASIPGSDAFAEDWDFWLSLVRHGWRARLVPERLFHYRIHQTNKSKDIVSRKGFHQECLWNIRLKHVFYDLSLFVFLNDPGFSPAEAVEALRRLKKPKNSQIFIINGFPKKMAGSLLRPFATHYFEISMLPYSTPLLWKAYILKHLGYMAASPEVLALDFHKKIWPEDIYAKLQEIKVRRKAQIISSVLGEKETGNTKALIWRTRKGTPESGFRRIPHTKRSCRIFTGPLEAFLMDARTFHEFPFESFKKKPKMPASEFALGYWAWKNDRRWFFYHRDRENNLPGRINHTGVTEKGVMVCENIRPQRVFVSFKKHAEEKPQPLTRLEFPVLGAVFEKLDRRLDLEAYCEAARLSSWPVVISGPVPWLFSRRLAKTARATPNLYILPTTTPSEGREKLAPVLGAGLYLLKRSSWNKEIIPDFIYERARMGFPVIHTPFKDMEGEGEVRSWEDLGIRIHRYQELPRWCLSMT